MANLGNDSILEEGFQAWAAKLLIPAQEELILSMVDQS